jgi:DNA-directed RNA polymerase specialized sigma24 family protein
MRTVSQLVRDRAAAEDVTQEAFLKLLQHWCTASGSSSQTLGYAGLRFAGRATGQAEAAAVRSAEPVAQPPREPAQTATRSAQTATRSPARVRHMAWGA